jgi:hypothetical protein
LEQLRSEFSIQSQGGSITLLDHWFPCVKPYPEGADVALNPWGEWIFEEPLEGGSDSGFMLVVKRRCLANCLVVPSLLPSVVVSPMTILVPYFPEIEPLFQPGYYHVGDPSLSCSLFVVGRVNVAKCIAVDSSCSMESPSFGLVRARPLLLPVNILNGCFFAQKT